MQDEKRELFKRLHASEANVRQASVRNTQLVQQVHETKSRLSLALLRLKRKQDEVAKLPQHIQALTLALDESRRDLANRKKAHAIAINSLSSRQMMEMDALYHVLPVRVSGVKVNTRQPMQVRVRFSTHRRNAASVPDKIFVQVSVANLRLPEVASKAPAQMNIDCQATSAALGYLALHLELLSSVLGVSWCALLRLAGPWLLEATCGSRTFTDAVWASVGLVGKLADGRRAVLGLDHLRSARNQ
jgi:hypothetical protein